jgi:hypothetical protein
MKKCIAARITVIMFTLALTLGPCTIAMATESVNATRNSLKSQGSIVYTDGENSVEIYSDDLYTIADQLDSYKTSMANQLAKIHTYFTSNTGMGTGTTTDSKANITHTTPASADTVDPLAMDFDTLLEGLAASQSIPTNVTEYGYASAQKLYKTDGGFLTTDSSGNTEISITAATANNLSAGTAAWVNGNLILGTGADNTAYYELNQIDADSMIASMQTVGNPCTLEKGKYLYYVSHAATTSHSSLYYILTKSITNDSLNSITSISSGGKTTGSGNNMPYLGYEIFFIDVADDSADISITYRSSTDAAGNIYFRTCTKIE